MQKIVVAGAWVREGRVLLARRASTKDIAPGKWHLPGGHVEFGEAPEAALKREIYEELAVEVRVGRPLHSFSYCRADEHTVGIVFAISGPASAVLRFDPADIEELSWVGHANLSDYLSTDDHNFAAALTALCE